MIKNGTLNSFLFQRIYRYPHTSEIRCFYEEEKLRFEM